MDATPTTAAPVRVHGVGKRFGETAALSDASLVGNAGEIHAIVGENGSGKSTLIKIIAGVHKPDEGEVEILGSSVTGLGPAQMQELGLVTVFQEVLIAEGASVLDNIFVGYDGLFRRRLDPRQKAARAREVLGRLVGREIDLDAPAGMFSLSERQLITVARALVREPKVLILDESTSALDLEASAAVIRELERRKEAGVCVLLVTHRIAELSVLADRATVLRDGRTVGLLSREEFSEERMLELMSGSASEVEAKVSGTSVRRSAPIGKPLLSVENARLREDSAAFSFQLREGEILGLAGLEGQGQVEIVCSLAGIERLADGEVRLLPDGGAFSGSAAAARRGLFYVSGDRKSEGSFPDLSILENFAMPAYRRLSHAGLIDWGAVKRSFAFYREGLKIRLGRSSQPITSLSGGNQQKVLLARWLAMEPKVLLLNDPTRGVDIGTKRDIYDVLRELAHEKGTGVVFVSTEIEELIGLCDRILVFRGGTIFAELASDTSVDDVLAGMFGAQRIDSVLDVADRSVREARNEEKEARA